MMNIKIVILLSLAVFAFCTKTDPPEALVSAQPKEKTEADKKIEAETIEDSFDDCVKFITKVQEYQPYKSSYMEMGQCVSYMGNTIDDFQISYDYFNEHEKQLHEPLNLKIYSELFIHHCNRKKLSVEECAIDFKSDERIIGDAFMNCRQFISMPKEDLVDNISEGQFCLYMKGTKEDCLSNTQIDWDIIQAYLWDDPGNLTKHLWIDFQIFSGLFKHYCKIYNLSVKELFKDRKYVTKVKAEKEMKFWNQLGQYF